MSSNLSDPSKCEDFSEFALAIEEVQTSSSRNDHEKSAILNDLLFTYRNAQCRTACSMHERCKKMLAGNLTSEMIEEIPAARFLSDAKN